MAIESDVNQADSRLAVKFYKRMEEDLVKTEIEGRKIYREVDYIKIMVPGDSLNERDTPVLDTHRQRFPIQWANYMNRQGAEGNFEGTPLTEWALITRSQAEELRAQRFYTVEQVASASDQQLQSIGMAAGMSPYTFRDKAKAFIESAKTAADFTNRKEEFAKLEAENARIKAETDAKMADMQAQLANLTSLLAAVGEKKPRAKKAETVEE